MASVNQNFMDNVCPLRGSIYIGPKQNNKKVQQNHNHKSKEEVCNSNMFSELDDNFEFLNITKCHCNQTYSSLSSNSFFSTTFSLNERPSTLSMHSGFWGVSFILLIMCSSITSSPLPPNENKHPGITTRDTTSFHRRHHEKTEKWINPCRILNTGPKSGSDGHIQSEPDSEILRNIAIQVRKAENQAKKFMQAFFIENFPHDDEKRYKKYHVEGLESLSDRTKKQQGENDFKKLDVDETIRYMFEGLQKFAVGLEQIVLDQARHGGSFHQYFHEAEFQLKYVLCELQIAMIEKNISYEDVTRDILRQEYRDVPSPIIRSMRDWAIFRDYVKSLEYMRSTLTNLVSIAEDSPNGILN